MNPGNSSSGGLAGNPLFGEWTGPFGLPPFAALKPEHFPPAFEHGLASHRAEIDAIAANQARPNFDNTVAAMERSGALLTRVSNVFFVLGRSGHQRRLAGDRARYLPPAGSPRQRNLSERGAVPADR